MRQTREAQMKQKHEVSWYVMMEYNRDDKDQQGILGMNDGKGRASYKIVHDI